MKKFFIPLLFLFVQQFVTAQDTLPSFTLRDIGAGRVIISWTNNYQLVKQISIQRSSDSIKNFKTILSVTDPMTHENGYADTKAPQGRLFYRLFIVLDRGMFLFSNTKRPVLDTTRKIEITKVDNLKLTDSVGNPNYEVNGNKRPDLFIPSVHVFTHKDGYVRINLPDAKSKKYNIKFYEDDGRFLFELKEIPDTFLMLDKTAFYHAGWFRFELFEDGNLIEKHKFLLAK